MMLERPFSNRSFYYQTGDTRNETYRLSTFERYPRWSPMNNMTRTMAQCGFYFTGFLDRVKCFRFVGILLAFNTSLKHCIIKAKINSYICIAYAIILFSYNLVADKPLRVGLDTTTHKMMAGMPEAANS